MMSFKIKGIHFNLEKPHYIFLWNMATLIKKTLLVRLSWFLKSHYNQEVTKLLLYITLGYYFRHCIECLFYRGIASPTAKNNNHGEKNIKQISHDACRRDVSTIGFCHVRLCR